MLIALDTRICRRASCSDWKEGIGMSEKKLELAMDSKEANRRYQYIQELNDAYLQKIIIIGTWRKVKFLFLLQQIMIHF